MRSGQIMMVVLLVLGVVATVGLSVISRSVTEVRVSSTQDQSERALEAAEVGLERSLGNYPTPMGGGTVDLPSMDASFNAGDITNLGASNNFAYPFTLDEGDTGTIALSDSGINYPRTYVRLCWGNTGDDSKVEVAIYYRDSTNTIRVKRQGYSRTAWNNFSTFGINTNQTCGTTHTYAFRRQISFTSATNGNMDIGAGSVPLFMRVRMLNASGQLIGVQSSGLTLPVQAGTIRVEGQAGDVVQRISATLSNDYDLPPMFDSAVYSGTSLVK